MHPSTQFCGKNTSAIFVFQVEGFENPKAAVPDPGNNVSTPEVDGSLPPPSVRVRYVHIHCVLIIVILYFPKNSKYIFQLFVLMGNFLIDMFKKIHYISIYTHVTCLLLLNFQCSFKSLPGRCLICVLYIRTNVSLTR